MSTCTACGGSLGDPFDFSSTTVSSCQCNLSGLVNSSEALPTTPCCVVSVADKTGAVNLNINDIDMLGYTLYTTDLIRTLITGVAPISYDPNSGEITHDVSGVSAGTYGSATEIPVVTVDDKGHVTAVTVQALVLPDLGIELPVIEALSGIGFLVKTAVGVWAFRSLTTTPRLAITYPTGELGDPIVDLTVSGVLAGVYGDAASYPIFTVDAYGRITSASSLTFPTPTLPAHTHSLGELSNVDDGVGASATVDDVLYWTGTEWSYKPLPAGAVLYEQGTITPGANWYECTALGDIDTVEMDGPINLVQRLVDPLGRIEVSVNAAFFITFATAVLSATNLGAGRYVQNLAFGTMPDGYRPLHVTTVALPSIVAATNYYNDTHVTAFTQVQVNVHLSVTIHPDGDMFINIALPAGTEYSVCRLGADAQIIAPLICSYPTKTFE